MLKFYIFTKLLEDAVAVAPRIRLQSALQVKFRQADICTVLPRRQWIFLIHFSSPQVQGLFGDSIDITLGWIVFKDLSFYIIWEFRLLMHIIHKIRSFRTVMHESCDIEFVQYWIPGCYWLGKKVGLSTFGKGIRSYKTHSKTYIIRRATGSCATQAVAPQRW